MALRNIAESRNVDKEQKRAGINWNQLKPEELPACKGENGGFMNEKSFNRTFKHVYSWNQNSAHYHLKPTTVTVPPYSIFGIPFRYMAKDATEELESKYPDFAKDEIAPFHTPWVYGAQRQYDILNWFAKNIQPEYSLAIMYCKNGNPVDEECGRLIVGIGEISKVHRILEYETDQPTSYPMWDVMLEHTIRPNLKQSKGFLLPYKEYLELDEDLIKDQTGKTKQQVIDEIKLSIRELDDNKKIFYELSYGSEFVSNHSMLIILNAARKCVENIIKHRLVGGDWQKQILWIDGQIAKVKEMIGPFPAFAEALSAIGIKYAYIIEQDLRNNGYCNIKENPWIAFNDLMNGKIIIDNTSYAKELPAYKITWDAINTSSRKILELLSRFEIDVETIHFWYYRPKSYDNLVSNPYIISEASELLDSDTITTEMIDLGVFADPQIQGKWMPQTPSLVESKIDKRRIRSLITYKLKTQLSAGDTLLSINELSEFVESSLSNDNMSLPINYLHTIKDFITQTLIFVDTEDGDAIQLREYYDIERYLAKIFAARAAKSVRNPIKEDWESLVKGAIDNYDETNARSRQAANDQIRALHMFSEKRLSLLSGPAGTGKTTVVKAFLKSKQILKEGVLLLAPTGKARVRLGSMSDGLEAQTVAQFLSKQGFFDWKKMQPYLPKDADQKRYAGARNIIIDECSMLTCKDFYILLNAFNLNHVNRIILIGDPYQLPPIGPGRTFSDLFNYLKSPKTTESLHEAITELKVVVRTITGGDSDILTLASWFAGNSPTKDADEIFDKIYQERLDNDLSVYTWKDESELKEKLKEVLNKELDNPTDSLADRIKHSIGLDDLQNALSSPDVVEKFQVLSPVINPMWGTYQLNSYFQEWTQDLSSKYKLEVAPQFLFPGDKVIQLINEKRTSFTANKEIQLSNGQIGFMKFVNIKWKSGNVVFTGIPNEQFTYYRNTSDDRDAVLELAYAITIHKSQGSDFNTVLVVLPKSGAILSRELIYTALTRAKKKLILLIEDNPSWLLEYTKPQTSVLAQRNSNLFSFSVRKEQASIPYIEGLIHKTLKPNLIVRSKSEVIIANQLYERGIKFDYEKLKEENGRRCIPDFTFEDASGDTIIWEHLGMLNNPAYKESWEKKLAFYNSIGFTEGVNLFTTVDHENGSIDSTEIADVIDKIAELI